MKQTGRVGGEGGRERVEEEEREGRVKPHLIPRGAGHRQGHTGSYYRNSHCAGGCRVNIFCSGIIFDIVIIESASACVLSMGCHLAHTCLLLSPRANN